MCPISDLRSLLACEVLIFVVSYISVVHMHEKFGERHVLDLIAVVFGVVIKFL